MNVESLINLQNQVNNIEECLQEISKSVKGLKIDVKNKLNSNIDIVPGIACKFAYDKSGLIIHAEKLVESDIPDIDIDHVKGLRKILSEKISKSDLRKITDIGNNLKEKVGDVVGCGCKINYDANGRIISASELTKEDIPQLSISDIEGLNEELELIKVNMTSENQSGNSAVHGKFTSGTFMKVTTDEYGHVISGVNKLTENDMPIDFINKINKIESSYAEFASRKAVTSLNSIVAKKLTANEPITSGTYTKVRVDSNGLVTAGDKLSIKDLPQLSINNIEGLDIALRSKASQEDIISLNETVNSMLSHLNKLGNVSKLISEIDNAAHKSDIKTINSRLEGLQKTVDEIVRCVPVELITTQINLMQSTIITLEGRVATLEKIILPNVNK